MAKAALIRVPVFHACSRDAVKTRFVPPAHPLCQPLRADPLLQCAARRSCHSHVLCSGLR
ncbi:hypothetical protein AAT19DRAFT_9582 [Rhodotorula toruloides]|uniref:Uncharacterized protein n=1 Tax=Rhodotorula toruloides TaxID=5286 RepID=A0A2T0A2N2_RHOTO|nr:hypothetical protein AAT19DRAFT_9582 [Rhodotorula toruloides]